MYILIYIKGSKFLQTAVYIYIYGSLFSFPLCPSFVSPLLHSLVSFYGRVTLIHVNSICSVSYLYHSPLSQASDGLVLRRMMTLGHGGLAKHYSNPQRLDRRDNLFRYQPACVCEAIMLISDKISRLGWRYFASYFVAFQNVFSPPPPLIGRVLDLSA